MRRPFRVTLYIKGAARARQVALSIGLAVPEVTELVCETSYVSDKGLVTFVHPSPDGPVRAVDRIVDQTGTPWQWICKMQAGAVDLGSAAVERAQALIDQGFYQTSARYRMLGRVPLGMTGIEALRRRDPHTARQFEGNLNSMALRQYVRCYADGDDKVEVDEETFKAFKALGGPVA